MLIWALASEFEPVTCLEAPEPAEVPASSCAASELPRTRKGLITTVGGLRRAGVGFTSLRATVDTTTPAGGYSSTSSPLADS